MSENDQLQLPSEAVALLEYWHDARGNDAIPHRKGIAPSRLRRWVGDVSVIHLHEGPKRFFVSLHGANVGRHIGPDFNKQYLEDTVPPASLSASIKPYEESIARNACIYAVMQPTSTNGLFSRLERLIMPFSDEDPDRVARFLVWVAPNDRDVDSRGSIYNGGDVGASSLAMFALPNLQPALI